MSEPQPEHASILDVARLAGVSPTTVSRSLRGLKHVSPATRARIAAAASELSYVASPAGSGLARGRTFNVAVVVPFVTRWFFAQVLVGASAVLRRAGYGLLLYDLADEGGRRRFFEQLPLRRRVDGVLVVSLSLAPVEVAALQSLQVPVVTVGSQEPAFAGVRIDDQAGMSTAVRHLRHLGHESVVMITALEDDDLGFSTARERRIAFTQAMAAGPVGEHVVAGASGVDGGAHAMEEVLGGKRLPTAVVAEYDEMAFGAMLMLRRAGLDIPGDVSIVGFDDHEMAPIMGLTTVAQPVRGQGEVAAQLMIDALHGAVSAGTDIVLPTRLVVRTSAAPPRRTRAARRTEPPASRSSRRSS